MACGDTVSGIPAGVEVYTATLNGANERPNPVTTTAAGTAVVTVLGNLVSWKVDVTSAIDSLTAGHIHRRAADSVAGGVVVPLGVTATGLDFTGTAANGSATVHDSIVVLMRAGRAYVNLHTRAFGGGEIRGELVRQ